MEKHLIGFIFGCLVAVASTRLVYKTSDGRYPAYITNDLRVRCTENGFFPHPANCTWFYRCVDHSGFDFFHVFFFQCEPGTVFHDEIDQCVFGTETDPPCASGGVDVRPPPLPVPPPTAPPPSPQPSITPSPVHIPITPETVTPPISSFPPPSPSITNAPGTPIPITVPSTPIPITVPSTPIPITVPSTPIPITVPSTPIPITVPSTPIPITVPSTPLPPSPPPTPDITEPPSEGSQSTTVCKECTYNEVCEIGKKPYSVKLCQVCRFGSGDFSTPKQECPHLPDPYLTSLGKCLYGYQLCPDHSQREEQQETFQDTLTFQCSDLKTRPDDPEIRSLYCHSYHYCSPFGNYLGTKTLCSNFFQCYKTLSGRWSTEIRNCMGQNLYSFDLDQCVPEPKATELCSRY